MHTYPSVHPHPRVSYYINKETLALLTNTERQECVIILVLHIQNFFSFMNHTQNFVIKFQDLWLWTSNEDKKQKNKILSEKQTGPVPLKKCRI